MYHRQPTGFGPSVGPRSNLGAKGPFSREQWQATKVHIAKVTFRTDRAALRSCLPDGYRLDEARDPSVTFEVMNLDNLPWLAGRGYNTLGIYINNVKHKDRFASFLALMFENMCDPIITGREELGFPKVFADITKSGEQYRLSWDGHEFLTMKFDQLVTKETPDLLKLKQWTTALRDGFLLHRYIPAVGQPGVADAEYPVFVPGAPKAPPLQSYEEPSHVQIKVVKSTFEQLPTLYPFVNALADLEVLEETEACIMNFLGASDCSAAQKIQ